MRKRVGQAKNRNVFCGGKYVDFTDITKNVEQGINSFKSGDLTINQLMSLIFENLDTTLKILEDAENDIDEKQHEVELIKRDCKAMEEDLVDKINELTIIHNKH